MFSKCFSEDSGAEVERVKFFCELLFYFVFCCSFRVPPEALSTIYSQYIQFLTEVYQKFEK
jgi:hypothetical protein